MPTTEYGVDAFFQNAGTSPKMVYDVSGTLVWSPHNLVSQSKDVNDYVLLAPGVTITANVAAGPLGDVTADQLAFNGGNDDYYYKGMIGNAISGAVYCCSVWLKAAAPVQIGFRCFGSAGDGTQTVAILNVTTAWQQFYGTCVMGSTSQVVYVTLDIRSGVTGDDGLAKTVIAADWQINRGTVPTAYLPTTTAARVGLALDYDPVTHAAKGLLCEPAATNLVLGSQDLSAHNIEGGAATLNNQIGPDGALTADTFTENTASFNHGSYGATGTTANADYTISRFIKMGTRRYATIGWADGTNGAYAVYDLQAGVVGSSAGIGTGTVTSTAIQAVGNGWYRCILTAKGNFTSPIFSFNGATAATITTDSYGRQVYLGTGATLFMGLAQIEAGTVATSPIPTLAASVTRAADKYNVTAASVGTSATAGSWWAEFYMQPGKDVYSERLIGTTASSAAALTGTDYGSGAGVDTYEPPNVLTRSITPPLRGTIAKAAVAFQANDRAVTTAGLPVVSDAINPTALFSPLSWTFGYSGSTTIAAYIRKVRYLPRRPSNAELQTMTT